MIWMRNHEIFHCLQNIQFYSQLKPFWFKFQKSYAIAFHWIFEEKKSDSIKNHIAIVLHFLSWLSMNSYFLWMTIQTFRSKKLTFNGVVVMAPTTSVINLMPWFDMPFTSATFSLFCNFFLQKKRLMNHKNNTALGANFEPKKVYKPEEKAWNAEKLKCQQREKCSHTPKKAATATIMASKSICKKGKKK